MSNTVAITVVIVAFAACVTDVRSRRIPNILTFGAALAALVFHTFDAGIDGLQLAALGWVTGTLLFLPFFALGGMGGGDVKLVAALGAWLGPYEALLLAMATSIAGGVLGLAMGLASGYLGTALKNVRSLLTYWVVAGIRPLPALTLEKSTAPRLAYALPIFAGVVVTLWIR